MTMIQENIAKVRENIDAACLRAKRRPQDVTLIAVSKTQPVELLREALDAGTYDLGENKVQELCDKHEILSGEYKDIRWHMIGHLQRNKVKQVIDKACLIHSVDSLRLAQQISSEAQRKQIAAHVLIEVNVAGEETKFGVFADEALALVEQVSLLPAIHVEGLMTIAPYVDNPEENRWIFQKIRQLSIDIGTRNLDNVNMNVLSMGMTNDYIVAVEEGATLVRVGTGIFGERNYNL